jgi:superfamily I DNA/RNA helicase
VRRLEKKAEDAESRIRNIKEMVASLDDDGPAAGTLAERLEAFLDNITLESDREKEDEPTGDAVTLITMHSCKGLEFPHVYIVGMEAGLLPHSRSLEEGTLDEERRLFYVAVTRAKDSLEISHCFARRKYGKLAPAHPSPFLFDLPSELVENADAKGSQVVAADAGRSKFAAMRAMLD